jgi:antirestriction protein
MRHQLEQSYNIQKITELEDEQKNKKRILKQFRDENTALVRIQKDQEKALANLSKENDYEKRINELNSELKQAKEHLRKL